jgi:hypothetical protein
VEQHDYQLYLAINDIDHTKTKAMSPQTNGKRCFRSRVPTDGLCVSDLAMTEW